MTRTFIFDSADPDNSNFVDEGATFTSDEEIDEDFLSFEDDLHTDDSSSTDESTSSSDRSRLSRFRSRTKTDRNESSDSSESSDDGRSQRFVRALSRAVMSSGASVVGRHRSSHAGSSGRTGSNGSPEGNGGATYNQGKRENSRRKDNRRNWSPTRQETHLRPHGTNLEDVREDDLAESSTVQIISTDKMESIPFPGVLNVPHSGGNGVAFNNDVNFGEDDDVFPSKDPVSPQDSSGIRLRRKSNGKNTQPEFMSTGSDFKLSQDGRPSKPHRASSQKRSRRRYSGSMGSATAAQRRAGWEPGVDIRTTDIILQSIGSAVTIVDYSVNRYRIIQTEVYPAPKTDENHPDPSLIVNKEFHEHLESRPSWSQVRWISVNGLSWEAISAISKRYQLHRLAIEDMVDIPQRTKVDLYPTHTFCCLPLHKLISFKPQSKQDFNFLDWALGRKPAGVSTRKSSSKLAPSKSNSSNSSRKMKSPEKKISPVPSPIEAVKLKEPSPPIQPPNITLPADSGRRRPIQYPVPPARKIVLPNSSSSSSSSSDNEDNHKSLSSILSAKGMETIYDWNNPYSAIQQKNTYIESKRPLSAYKRAVGVEQVSLFLTSQSTVISFFERSAADIERPLLARLSTQSTILRESCDPSLLLQAIVDAIVDLLQPIIAAYRRRMDELEIDAMINPSMSHTRDLHLMAGELSMLRNTIVPVTSLVLSLRDHTSAPTPTAPEHQSHNGSSSGNNEYRGFPSGGQSLGSSAAPPSHIKIPIISQGNSGTGTANDPTNAVVAAAVAAVSATSAPAGASSSSSSSSSSLHPNNGPPVLEPPIVGSRISGLAKVYLADISDHLLSHTQDLDVMRNNTKNMIDLVFNTISIQSSDSVKQLSLVTVIFLPLSFWTGYFGMNFTNFEALDHPISYYWVIAIPFCVGVLVLAMMAWIQTAFFRFKNFVKKRIRNHQRKVKKQLRKKARKKELSHV